MKSVRCSSNRHWQSRERCIVRQKGAGEKRVAAPSSTRAVVGRCTVYARPSNLHGTNNPENTCFYRFLYRYSVCTSESEFESESESECESEYIFESQSESGSSYPECLSGSRSESPESKHLSGSGSLMYVCIRICACTLHPPGSTQHQLCLLYAQYHTSLPTPNLLLRNSLYN